MTLNAYGYSGIIPVSNEFLGSSVVAAEDMVSRALGQRLAKGYGPRLATGTGTNQPTGLTVGASDGITTAATGSITADELIKTFYAVPAEYRAQYAMRWVMSDSTHEALRKLKDSDNNYLLGNIADMGADRLLGAPITIDNNMPELASGNVPIVFGAIEDLFVVRATALRVDSSTDAAFTSNQTVFRAVWDLDSKVLDPAGIVKVTAA